MFVATWVLGSTHFRSHHCGKKHQRRGKPKRKLPDIIKDISEVANNVPISSHMTLATIQKSDTDINLADATSIQAMETVKKWR